MSVYHDFSESLAFSHAAEDMPFWREVYEKAFPDMVAMINHRRDGVHQRNGIDRSLILSSSKQILVDEKVRGRNKKTGKVYDDVLLEYISDDNRNEPGWVCKKLLCDYIAYAIAPLGKCYLLPVIQLQAAWSKNRDRWIEEASTGTNGRRVIVAPNRYSGRSWNTISLNVSVRELFCEIGSCLRVSFAEFEMDD